MNHEYGYNISPGGGGRANPNNTDTHKQCPVCKQIKSRKDDYWQSKYTHDGVAYCCKICLNDKVKEYRNSLSPEEKERRNQLRRDKYVANPEPYIQQAQQYYTEHKEDIVKYKKKYYQKNKDKVTIRYKENYLKNQKERQERAKQDRERYKEANKKLSLEEICARTPTKECRKCKNTLSTFNNFYRDHTRFDGLNRLCKECCKKNSSKQRELKKLQNGRKFSETTY